MTDVLNKIAAVLGELCDDTGMVGAYYGAASPPEGAPWNYFVFGRDTTEKSSNRLDLQNYYRVAIVHEDYIPEGMVPRVIAALETAEAGPLLRSTTDAIQFNYQRKTNTDLVVEWVTIRFFCPHKRGRD